MSDTNHKVRIKQILGHFDVYTSSDHYHCLCHFGEDEFLTDGLTASNPCDPLDIEYNMP